MNSDSDSNSSTEYGAFLGGDSVANNTSSADAKPSNSYNPNRTHHSTTYRLEWQETFPWLRPYPDNFSYALCALCKSAISISHGGANDIKRHADTVKHKKLMTQTNGGKNIDMDAIDPAKVKVAKPREKTRNMSLAQRMIRREQRGRKRSFPPRKQYFLTYNTEWEEDYPWLQASDDAAMAECKICQSVFSIEYRGVHDVNRHMSRLRHQKALELLRTRGIDVYSEHVKVPIKKRTVKKEHIPPDSTQKSIKKIKTEVEHISYDDDDDEDDDDDVDDIDDANYNNALYWDSFMNKKKSSTPKKKKLVKKQCTEDKVVKTEDSYSEYVVSAVSAADTAPDVPVLNDPFENVNLNENDFDDDDHFNDGDDDDADADYAPPKTEPKLRESPNLFNPKWTKTFPWAMQSPRKKNSVECKICFASIPLVNPGTADLCAHEKRQRHRKLSRCSISTPSSSSKVDKNKIEKQNVIRVTTAAVTPPPPPSPPKVKITLVARKRAELLLAFHVATKSDRLECLTHFLPSICYDSELAQNLDYSESQVNRIVNTVFLPAIHQQFRVELGAKNIPFSIATYTFDGTIRPVAFPVLIRYFTSATGLQTRLLVFISPETEDSPVEIAQCILTRLDWFGLSRQNVTSFTADNSPINFEQQPSNVFAELTKRNPNILPIKCYLESINEMFQTIVFHFPIDMETTIIRCINEIRGSSASKRTAQLDRMYDWSCSDWLDIFDDWPITAATLVAATTKLLEHFGRLKLFFQQHRQSTPIILMEFFNHPMAEFYLYLYRLVGHAMQSVCRRLKAHRSSAIDLHDAFGDLRTIMQRRSEEETYEIALRTMDGIGHTPEMIQQFMIDAHQCFSMGLSELDTIFPNWGSSPYRHLSVLRLQSRPPQLEDFTAIAREFHIVGIDEAQLRDECEVMADYYDMNRLSDANGDAAASIAVDQQARMAMEWWKIFLKLHPLPNLEQICGWVFSLPMSNWEATAVRSEMVKMWRQTKRCPKAFGQHKNALIVRHSYGAMEANEFVALLDSANGERMIKKWMASS